MEDNKNTMNLCVDSSLFSKAYAKENTHKVCKINNFDSYTKLNKLF